ncbi:quinone oxidoreductase family protein [Umezawaea tangerina]|uniref:NADPH2:quinone reductase n=1 Tax=Umezawaea tangerina TaxID=84725 RepID=A0A2T0T1A4_9PSEU|nr:quinone oxidoreductase [Umezawaea tangerina]PRY39431.1 NADPH2:quinone reductase [Umezawaea tangerina]
MKAIEIDEAGGPEVLRLRERQAPRPGPGEILVDVRVAGVNFFDTSVRKHRLVEVPGAEGAGVVLETGEGVHGFAPGDRVAWMDSTRHGGYAEQVVLPATCFVAVPGTVDDETAAALVLQGLTAHHLATVSHAVRPGDVALVHAAAGGVGMLLTQLVKARGGTVIGLVSRPEKVGIATEAGADHVLVSTGAAFVGPVRDLTGGEGVHVVYDGAGATTFDASLEALRTHGTLVFYGPLIGEVPSIRVDDLPRSVRLTYPTTDDHLRGEGALATHMAELFALVGTGELVVRIGGRYPLADAARAHADIESRATTGKLLLFP